MGQGWRRYGGADKSAIEGKEIDWGLVREILRLAKPYRRNIVLFDRHFGGLGTGRRAAAAVPPGHRRSRS